MNANDRIQKAKLGLVLEQPFYSALLFGLEYLEDRARKTCSTNGKVIFYNPDFVNGITIKELEGVLAHEILHITNCHHLRRGKRNKKKWNVATDYAINALLRKEKFVLPKGSLYRKEFDGISAEEIYSLLDDEDIPPDDPGGCGEVEDAAAKDDKEKKQLEEEVQQKVIQAAFIAQAQHKCPEYIKRILEEILRPRINWKEALSQFLSTISRNDYSWLFPNPRYLHTGLYLPSLRSEEPGSVILIIDTSYSIYDELIKQFAGEAQEILNIFKISLTIIYCDDLVRSVQNLEPDEDIKLEPFGGGGTDFIPGFEYIEENDLQPKAVVYLTDGYCNTFPESPSYPVLWAIYSYCDFKPPFGEVIKVID